MCPYLPVVLFLACDYTKEACESSELMSPYTGRVRLLTHGVFLLVPFEKLFNFRTRPSHKDKSLEEVVRMLRLGEKHPVFGIAKYRSLIRNDFTELGLRSDYTVHVVGKGHSVCTLSCLKTGVIYHNHLPRWHEACQ